MEQFEPVKQFLETGDFEIPTTDTYGNPFSPQAKKNRALKVCAGAWEIVTDLSLEDLMETIVEKSKALRPWPASDSIFHIVQFVNAARAIEGLLLQPDIVMWQLIVELCKQHEKSERVEMLLEDFFELRRDFYKSKVQDAEVEMEKEYQAEDEE